MRKNDFAGVFEKQVEKLDKYFHGKLSDEKLMANFEDRKNELIQETAFQVLLKIHSEKYNDYDLKSLIWLKAPDVWKKYIKKVATGRARKVSPLDSLLDDIPGVPSPAQTMEKQDFEEMINCAVPQDTWDILLLHAQGYKYSEIAKELNKSENALMTKISRFKSSLKNSRGKNAN